MNDLEYNDIINNYKKYDKEVLKRKLDCIANDVPFTTEDIEFMKTDMVKLIIFEVEKLKSKNYTVGYIYG